MENRFVVVKSFFKLAITHYGVNVETLKLHYVIIT